MGSLTVLNNLQRRQKCCHISRTTRMYSGRPGNVFRGQTFD